MGRFFIPLHLLIGTIHPSSGVNQATTFYTMQHTTTQISKTISHALRHAPAAYGQWNGSYNSQYAPAGVYLCQLEMTTCDGPLKTTGNLTLIR
jgi:hypothetical protein